MKFTVVLVRAIAAIAVVCATGARAQDDSSQASVDKIWHTTYDVAADGRVTQTVVHRYQVLQERRLEQLKVYSISYSTSIQTGEILEAYTLKKDGRKIKVPPNNFQTQRNEGRRGAGPAFSDYTRVSVVFPDMAVGDSAHVSYKITSKEAIFPGQFSMAYFWTPYAVTEDARLTIRAPASMALKTEANHVKAQPPLRQGDRQVLEWRYSNLKARTYSEEDNGIWAVGEWPGVLVSTFGSYEAIAKAYGDRALPKAQPAPRIRELVAQVLGSESQPREKARKLYEWVSRNITYGGNCIGVGAVVPRDLDVVLDNKMGDCKDHATLLQSMLAAAGITSEQVLVNAGNQYDLPATPVVSMVNHVMNYLPDFKLYVDATAKDIPFGYLPDSAYAKPVIHVGAANALATVPGERHEANEQRLRMTLKITPLGAATGTLHVQVKGSPAASMRAYMREVTGDAEKEFVKGALSSSGMRGRGTLQKGDTQGMGDQYEYSVSFEIDNYLRGGATGAFHLAPVMGSPFAVVNFAGMEDRTMPKRRERCHGFHSYETYDIELPDNMKLLSTPDDAQVRASLVDYTARYEKTAAGIRVVRELHDKTPESICPPQMSADLIKQALPVSENLRTQVLYKRSAP